MDANTISKIFTIILIIGIVIFPAFIIFIIDRADSKNKDKLLDDLSDDFMSRK